MQFELFGHEFGIMYLLSQVFALLATLLSLYAFQRKRKEQILNYTAISAVCSIFHYLLLGAWSGVATKTVGAVRNMVAAYETRKKRTFRVIPLFFVLFYIVAGILTYEAPISFLPVIAASIYTVAIYFGDAKKIRYVAVLTASLWLVYGVYVFSIAGVLSEAIFIVNDLVAIYRYRKDEKHKKRKSRVKNKIKKH